MTEKYSGSAIHPKTLEIEKVEIIKTSFEAHHEYEYVFPDGLILKQAYSAMSEI